ncbi:hypothetical protein MCAG_05312 [Micromonospora sp. ATCC 39149]|nr:hypothetical protein MCAG_05312 [Micromonospora sp. ATCC 39149]
MGSLLDTAPLFRNELLCPVPRVRMIALLPTTEVAPASPAGSSVDGPPRARRARGPDTGGARSQMAPGPTGCRAQGLVQVMLLGGMAPSPVAVNPKVVVAFEPNVPL